MDQTVKGGGSKDKFSNYNYFDEMKFNIGNTYVTPSTIRNLFPKLKDAKYLQIKNDNDFL
jgi:hypothetical protein